MPNFVKDTIAGFVESLNGISNTVWGVLILSVSMWMGYTGKTELAYYFAGVGSTLMGVKHEQSNTINAPRANTVTNTTTTGTEAK